MFKGAPGRSSKTNPRFDHRLCRGHKTIPTEPANDWRIVSSDQDAAVSENDNGKLNATAPVESNVRCGCPVGIPRKDLDLYVRSIVQKVLLH